MSKKKWTREACYEAALDCKSRNEMKHKYTGAYKVARINGWLDDYDWFEPSKTGLKYTREECYKIAQGCKTKAEMRRKNMSAYNVAWKNNWFDDYDWFEDGYKLAGQNAIVYTKEYCLKIARDFKTVKELRAKYPNVYDAICRNNWNKHLTWLEREPKLEERSNTVIYAYIFQEHNTVYVGLSIDKKNRNLQHHSSGPVFNFAKKHNKPIPEMTILESGLHHNTEALEMEDYYINKFRSEGWNMLNKAKSGVSGSLGNLHSHKLSKKTCYILSLDCTTRSEFKKKHYTAYQKSVKNRWLDEWEHLAAPKTGLKWTPEKIMNEVYKFDKFSDFRKYKIDAYNAAWRKGIIPEIKAYYAQNKRA